jgi:hypothetical protein
MVSFAGAPKVSGPRAHEGSRSGAGRWPRGLLLAAIFAQSCHAYIFQGFNADKVHQPGLVRGDFSSLRGGPAIGC